MKSIVMLTAALVLVALASNASAEGQFLLGPRVGFYKVSDADDGNWFGGASARAMFMPGLGVEVAADYHNEEAFSDQLDVRTIPVTASAIVGIIPQLYLAGGVGWYHTNYDWDEDAEENFGVDDDTNRDFGYQFGGGVMLGSMESRTQFVVDGRYHVLNDEKFENDVEDLEFDEINPDFWSINAGLLFRF